MAVELARAEARLARAGTAAWVAAQMAVTVGVPVVVMAAWRTHLALRRISPWVARLAARAEVAQAV